MKKINTIIIGAGQAGLSVSYCLTQKSIEHIVLEKGKVGQEWRERRWDAFRLITPNGMTQLLYRSSLAFKIQILPPLRRCSRRAAFGKPDKLRRDLESIPHGFFLMNKKNN